MRENLIQNKSKKNRILIIAFNDLKKDPRVTRQIHFLKQDYQITTMGLKDSGIDGVDFIPINQPKRTNFWLLQRTLLLGLHLYDKYYNVSYLVNEFLEHTDRYVFDIIIVNDVDPLPLAVAIKNDAKIIFDAHEYYLKQYEDRFFWKYFLKGFLEWALKKGLKSCDAVTAVSQGIAQEYEKDTKIKPIVITNAARYEDLYPSETNENEIKIIHHGGSNPSRKLEKLIKMMEFVDERFSLYLMLVQNHPRNYQSLKQIASRAPNKKIYFIDPVDPKNIVNFINKFDIGVYILEPSNFNSKYSLPNKLFEFIQARLAIAIGPSIEMKAIVEQYNCGIVSEDFDPVTMAKELNKLTKDKIMYYKFQSNKYSKDASSENNLIKLGDLIKILLKQN